MAHCNNKICHFARVDSRYGSKDGQLETLDKPFLTITSAIKEIHKKRIASATSRWIISLSPCTFEENVKLRPFIDIYGTDAAASVIKGTVSAQKLYSSTDQTDLRCLTIDGYVDKSSVSKGYLSLFNVTINTSVVPFLFSAGHIRIDGCNIIQNILIKSKNIFTFYTISGSGVVNLNVKNTRHERYVKNQIKPNVVVNNITNTNVNNNTIITLQDNSYNNTFKKLFLGLLIPYDNNQAAGLFQTHNGTLTHNFMQGAGNGSQIPVVGQSYSTAFILARKITAAGKNLEVEIHTTEVLNVPEVGFNVFSGVHSASSTKVKTKHTGWQNFREIPESLTILDNTNTITVTPSIAERSMLGSASDNKTFVSRLALQILTISGLVGDTDPQGPSMLVDDSAGFVDVQQAPVVLLLPYSANLTLGQQITFNFKAAGPILIKNVIDSSNPPPKGTKAYLIDNNIPGNWTSIVYNILNIKPFPNIYPPSSIGAIEGISSVVLTLTSYGGNPNGPQAYYWSCTSTPAKSNLLGTGTHNLTVPPNTTMFYLTAWAGGGAGGKNGGPESGSDNGGGGGGGGAAFTLSQATSGVTSFLLSVGSGSTKAGDPGNPTSITYSNSMLVANGGGGGGAGPTPGVLERYAIGGAGGNVQYYVNGNVTPIPPNVISYNGSAGGNGEPASNYNTSTGNQGISSATGYDGGAGGTLNQNNSNIIISGPGGGSGGFNGIGASAANFKYTGNFTQNWEVTYAGTRVATGSGAGGSGEGPTSVAEIANGGNGGAVYLFM